MRIIIDGTVALILERLMLAIVQSLVLTPINIIDLEMESDGKEGQERREEERLGDKGLDVQLKNQTDKVMAICGKDYQGCEHIGNALIRL